MPAKTAQQIQAEADRMFGKKASKEKFEWRRAQQAAAGLEQETKKRGGVAGAYDRNKKLVSAAATAAGYMFGGPAGAGLARGAVQGLDRPGQGGIGFDVRRGAKGFAEGYGAGSAANIGKSALSKLFAPGGSGAGAGAAGAGVGGAPTPTPTPTPTPAPTPGDAPAPTPLYKNPQVIAGALGGISDVMGQRSQQAIQEQQLAQQAEQFQQRFDAEEEERKRQQAQANRLASFFMPPTR